MSITPSTAAETNPERKPSGPEGDNSSAHLGLLDVNAAHVLHHLRKDLKDDWFPDPLHYSDCLTIAFMKERLADLQNDSIKGFQATGCVVRDVPKKGGALRYSLETPIIDRFVYQALVEELARPLDALQSSRVFSHRYQSGDRKEFFKPAVPQWSLFKDAVRDRGSRSWVVEADLQNFYESITLSTLRTVLLEGIGAASGDFRDKSRMRYAAEMLLTLLPVWCYAPSHGLPQNRDASSFLANQYMRPVDLEMTHHNWEYFRYMDDIRICVGSRDEARRALVMLTTCLRKQGLSLNSKKTAIHAPDTDGHKAMFAPDDRRLRDVDNMWHSRSQETIARSLVHLAAVARELIDRNDTDSRTFRFCVNRLQQLAQVDNISIEIPERDPLKRMVLARLIEDASVSDSLCGFLKAVGLTELERFSLERDLLDEKTYLYEWQRYHIVSLLLDQGHSSPRFLSAAERSIGDSTGTASIPPDLALVVLGRHGTDVARHRIADNYAGVCRTHIEHRAGLIAIHELDYGDIVEPKVARHIPLSLRGTYRAVRARSAGIYFAPRPTLPAATLIDVVSAYV
jgi:hypothetical protein